MAVLKSDSVKKMHKMLLKDLGVKNCEELKMKFMKVMMRMHKKAMNCPIHQELMKKVE